MGSRLTPVPWGRDPQGGGSRSQPFQPPLPHRASGSLVRGERGPPERVSPQSSQICLPGIQTCQQTAWSLRRTSRNPNYLETSLPDSTPAVLSTMNMSHLHPPGTPHPPRVHNTPHAHPAEREPGPVAGDGGDTANFSCVPSRAPSGAHPEPPCPWQFC